MVTNLTVRLDVVIISRNILNMESQKLVAILVISIICVVVIDMDAKYVSDIISES